jgi:hypothetical protein
MGVEETSQELSANIRWTSRLEEYFAQTGEKASCLAWVHKRAEDIYTGKKTYLDLPVIILSSVTGFASVGAPSLFSGNQSLASLLIGVASLTVSILNTVGSYFNWAKRAEGHRISAIHYARLYRFIMIEMALPRDERMSPHDLLKYVKDQYDRLAEISPMIPATVLADFKSKFSKYTDISKPEEANGLTKINVYVDEMRGATPFSITSSSPVVSVKMKEESDQMSAKPLKI